MRSILAGEVDEDEGQGLDPFADLASPFIDHYRTLRGVVRHALVARQLDTHLSGPPGRVADIGGGTGPQAIRLARLGYEVVVLDPSEDMIRRAREAVAAEQPEVRRLVEIVRGSGEEAPRILGQDAFDAVLCHGVVMYLDSPTEMIRALSVLARTGGIVSLLAKNAEALALRPALHGRWRDALAAFDADRDVGGLGVLTRGDYVERLRSDFTDAGLSPIEWYGVRVLTDHLGRTPPGEDLDDVLEAEWEAGRRDPYRRVGRLIHLVGRRL